MDRSKMKSEEQNADITSSFINRLSEISDLVSEGLFLFDPHTSDFRYMTKNVPDILGLSPEELKDCTSLSSLFHEDDQDVVKGTLRSILEVEDRLPTELVIRTVERERDIKWTKLKVQRVESNEENGPHIAGSLSNIQSLVESQMESQFYLDLMTHDITNKHQIILMNLEIMRAKSIVSGEKIGHLSSCVKQLGEAMDTIRTVKILADVGGGDIETGPVDLIDSINQGLEAVENYYHFQRSNIDMSLQNDPILVEGDRRLHYIIYHLVSNSIIHNSRDDPKVEITINGNISDIEIHIMDNGPGIPEDVMRDLKTIKPRNISKVKGRGLGLYLTIQLLDAYGGSFSISPNKNGQGSDAMIKLKRSVTEK